MNKKSKTSIIIQEIKIMMGASKSLTSKVVFTNALDGIFMLLNIYFLNNFYESVINRNDFSTFAFNFIALGITILVLNLLNGITNYLMDKQKMAVMKVAKKSLFDKIDRLSVLKLQEPEILNTINSAKNGMEDTVTFLIGTEILVSFYLVYLTCILLYLIKIHPLLCLVMVCTYIPSLISYKTRNKIKIASDSQASRYRRQMEAYESYVAKRDFFKESRFWKANDFFVNKYINANDKYITTRKKEVDKLNFMNLIINISHVLGFACILLVIYYLIKKGEINVAQIATLFTLIITLYGRLNELMNFHIANMSESVKGIYFMNKIRNLHEERPSERLQGEGLSIKLEKVNFSYPKCDDTVLNDINLHIKNGELIALVGENGAGKSTLAKIISGLYENTDGSVLYNDIDRRVLDIESVYRRESVVFQDFCKYDLSIKDNIVISDYKINDMTKVLDVSRSTDIHDKIVDEKDELDTLLSKKFGGTDWSGGLWQRLAIARAMYRNHDMIIFDEPTASIDPVEEYQIIKKLIEICRGKTAIFVTHRIGAAKLADRIITMKDGKIVEIGNHEELMENKAEYASLYNAQKQWYV